MEHKTYTKINTLYKRYREGDLKNCIILGDYSDKETEYLKDNLWLCFEKNRRNKYVILLGWS